MVNVIIVLILELIMGRGKEGKGNRAIWTRELRSGKSGKRKWEGGGEIKKRKGEKEEGKWGKGKRKEEGGNRQVKEGRGKGSSNEKREKGKGKR
jgi:hypothetical protein